MKTEELNNKGQTLAPYASPSVVVIEVSVQRVLCGSTEKYGNENNNPWLNN